MHVQNRDRLIGFIEGRTGALTSINWNEVTDIDLLKLTRGVQPILQGNNGEFGLCPVCGDSVRIIGRTIDNRLIGSCRDAFTLVRWLE